ncbi:hypothetical protein A5662_05430 [Mycobacteriaceae bacterium 1482268.1]|nr:hypothetical protein A5662_05430 [Mycobacteriaceae bacterium 1482268.1]
MSKLAIRSALAASVMSLGTALGMGSAAAQPDLGSIPVHPNEVIDATAFTAAAPVMNPDGQPGVSTTFTHRDGSRQIVSTVLVLADPAAATGALDASRAQTNVVDAKTAPAAVGSGGTIVSGLSADRSQSLSVLTFTEGNAAATVKFSGPAGDPVPADLVLDYGQRQDAAIKAALAA